MAFLGHKNGPRLSEILKRNRAQLEVLAKGAISQTTPVRIAEIAGGIIEREEKAEAEGLVASARFISEHRPNEFVYVFDCGTHFGPDGVKLHYTLTDGEVAALGSDYKRDLLPPHFPPTYDIGGGQVWDELTGCGEFSGPGVR